MTDQELNDLKHNHLVQFLQDLTNAFQEMGQPGVAVSIMGPTFDYIRHYHNKDLLNIEPKTLAYNIAHRISYEDLSS